MFDVFLVLHVLDYPLSWDVLRSSSDNSVTDLSDQKHYSGRTLVVVGVQVNYHYGVHDGDEEVGELDEVEGGVHELGEVVFEGGEVHEVLIGFLPALNDFLLESLELVNEGTLAIS